MLTAPATVRFRLEGVVERIIGADGEENTASHPSAFCAQIAICAVSASICCGMVYSPYAVATLGRYLIAPFAHLVLFVTVTVVMALNTFPSD